MQIHSCGVDNNILDLKEGYFKLGNWIETQRKAKDTLTPERLERLNA